MIVAKEHRVVERHETVRHGQAWCRDCSWSSDPVGAFSRAKGHTEETGHSTYIDDVCRIAFEREAGA